MAETDRDKKVTQTYSMATAKLRDLHRDEFNQLRVEAATELGIEWSPRPDEETKAKADLEAILAKYPHFKDEVLGEVSPE